MEMLSFDLKGKFAHFRKYYANNTALSFSIPPRTTLMGIVAAILGLPRDSYYQALGPGKVRFAVRPLTPLKKSFHRLNLLKVEGASDFRGQKGRVQTPFEIVTGRDLKRDIVAYRVYVSPLTAGIDVFEQLESHLKKGAQVYNLSLGSAFCLAALANVRLALQSEKRSGGDSFLPISSVIPVEQVDEIDLTTGKLLIEEELLPGAFIKDFDRELSQMHRVLFPTDGQPMQLKITGEYFAIFYEEEEEGLITFLE